MHADHEVRAFAESLPVFEPASTPCTPPKALAEARVAIVTTAGLRADGQLHWKAGDEGYHVLPGDARDLGLAHLAPNFDRSGYLADPNVVFPVDRLRELAERGLVASVADRHYSFMGGQPDHQLATMRLGREGAARRATRHEGLEGQGMVPVGTAQSARAGAVAACDRSGPATREKRQRKGARDGDGR